ncbi:MAG: anti-sigma factor antagonist [Clostridia bacterium]|nr:anti-sigma factor antagonist [Clostridia bacterium]
MNVKTVFADGELTAYLSGEIDHHASRGIRQVIDGEIERNHPSVLSLDFRNVRFMDSSGIGLIMGRYRLIKMTGGVVRLENVPPPLERIIALSGVRSITE